jgi:pimeloyl-ACP methyl ester carboxylesterase
VSAGPPVLLLHGWGSTFAKTWVDTGVSALFEDAGRTVIGVDLLGHGDAPKPHEPEAYSDLTRRVVDALPSDTLVDAVGFSLGAVTLLELACREPDRFSRLVLAGVGRNLFERDQEGTSRILAALAGDAPESDVRSFAFAHYANQPGNDPLALAAVLTRSAPPMTAARLASITCPALVVIGDKDFAGPGDPLVEALPNAKLITLRNTDHFATPESFAFIDAMLDFLGAEPV